MKRTIFPMLLLFCGAVLAQQSPNHDLEEHTLNSGGHPAGGLVLTSPGFLLTLGAIGQGVGAPASAGASFSVAAGFVTAYPPPGEVANPLFQDGSTLIWDAERSVGFYNLYQGFTGPPFDPGYGICQTGAIPSETVTISSVPDPGQAYFLLVTAENRLSEEGTKGFDSAGSKRDNSSPCP